METEVDPGLLDKLNEAVASETILGYSFGTMIAPSSEVKGGLFPQDDAGFKADAVTVRTGNCPIAERNGKLYFAGNLNGIPVGYRDKAFSGVGYLEIRLPNGEKSIVRAPFDPKMSSASPAVLAKELLDKQGKTLTEEERFRLEALLAGTETVNFPGDVFQEFYALPDALYFRYNGTLGCYCRLTDTGETGWRFEAQKEGPDLFREIGAAQAFSLAMNEKPAVDAKPLSWEIIESGKVLSVTGENGSTVRIDLTSGAITLLSPEKKELYLAKYEKLASETGYPVVAHPVLKYQDDKNVYSIKDEYLFGDALLVAPILTDGNSRRVYLPKGEWIDLLTGETVSGGKAVTVKAAIGQIPVFLDTASPDADALRSVFSGETWSEIVGGSPIQ